MEKCTQGFTPAGDGDATAECRASDITLAEFRTLNGKMDAANARAETVEDYIERHRLVAHPIFMRRPAER